jgi:hypothetical protein
MQKMATTFAARRAINKTYTAAYVHIKNLYQIDAIFTQYSFDILWQTGYKYIGDN